MFVEQDDQSGRQRGDKNRRRNRNPRGKEERKDAKSQGENTSQVCNILHSPVNNCFNKTSRK